MRKKEEVLPANTGVKSASARSTGCTTIGSLCAAVGCPLLNSSVLPLLNAVLLVSQISGESSHSIITVLSVDLL